MKTESLIAARSSYRVSIKIPGKAHSQKLGFGQPIDLH